MLTFLGVHQITCIIRFQRFFFQMLNKIIFLGIYCGSTILGHYNIHVLYILDMEIRHTKLGHCFFHTLSCIQDLLYNTRLVYYTNILYTVQYNTTYYSTLLFSFKMLSFAKKDHQSFFYCSLTVFAIVQNARLWENKRNGRG